jgi:hypothetical protein
MLRVTAQIGRVAIGAVFDGSGHRAAKDQSGRRSKDRDGDHGPSPVAP